MLHLWAARVSAPSLRDIRTAAQDHAEAALSRPPYSRWLELWPNHRAEWRYIEQIEYLIRQVRIEARAAVRARGWGVSDHKSCWQEIHKLEAELAEARRDATCEKVRADQISIAAYEEGKTLRTEVERLEARAAAPRRKAKS